MAALILEDHEARLGQQLGVGTGATRFDEQLRKLALAKLELPMLRQRLKEVIDDSDCALDKEEKIQARKLTHGDTGQWGRKKAMAMMLELLVANEAAGGGGSSRGERRVQRKRD